jgi:hypothetical protein
MTDEDRAEWYRRLGQYESGTPEHFEVYRAMDKAVREAAAKEWAENDRHQENGT